MTDRILQILDNVRYWDTCPEAYKKEIETFLEAQNQALRIHDIVGQSEQLLQAYKEGFDAATECLIGANKVVQERKLQQ